MVYRLAIIVDSAAGYIWSQRLCEWAQTTYPELWEELTAKYELKEDEIGIKHVVGLERTLSA